MGDSEEQLQKEWRDIVIKKLDSLDNDVKSIHDDVREAVTVAKDVTNVKAKVEELEKEIGQEKVNNANLKVEVLKEVKENYTSKDQFSPIQKLVWGAATIVIFAVISGIVALVLKF